MVSISSQVQNISPWGQWGQKLLHMLRCFLCSFLAFWVTEQQTNCPQETSSSAIWCWERWRIKPLSYLLFDTEVIHFGMTIMPLGYGHFGAFSQSDQAFQQCWSGIKLLWLHSEKKKKKKTVKFKTSSISTSYRNPQDSPKGLQNKYTVKGQELINRIRKLKNMKNALIFQKHRQTAK